MPYYLWKAVLGRTPKIEITKEEHDAIIVAWRSIVAVVAIEEEWDSLIRNYIELEMELLKSAMHSIVLNHESYHEMQQERLEFSRRLSNLLQTCRSYIDHAPHHLGKLDDGAFKAAFDGLRKTAHAAHFGYRFMDAMRNYAQHRGVPLHGSTYNAQWTGDLVDDAKGLLQHSVAASVNLDKIREDRNFNAKVRGELEGVDKLDVATLTREYIEALGSIQTALRARLKESLTNWKGTVRAAMEQYAAVNKGDVVGLSVAEFSTDDRLIAAVNIFDELLERQERLVRRNGSLVNLRRRYVTNEILPPKRSRAKNAK
ncbi:MAG: hypothetical protein H0W74_10325 [Sphingosinicella sp.]|nr:hypothetical protein [Sphingosinicella sp.]